MNKCKTKKSVRRRNKKNIAGQVLTYNSKNFHWLNKNVDLERTMNGLGKQFRKTSNPKNWKTVKIKVRLPHVNKKPIARNRTFVQRAFSHSTLKLEEKISRQKTTRFFRSLPVSAWPKSLLQFDFKNHKYVWTDLKRQRPNTIQILWIVKNQEHRNIAPLSLQL